MPNSDNRLDALLEQAFTLVTPRWDDDADRATPRQVPSELRARILERVAQVCSQLLARQLRDAGERIGWSVDDLAEEASDQADLARQFLRMGGDPSGLVPRAFARLFWRAELSPDDWHELLLQTIAAYAVFQPPMHGEIWGRTHGLVGPLRADALSGATGGERDPERAEKVARGFVEEVVEEWKILKSRKLPRTSPDDE